MKKLILLLVIVCLGISACKEELPADLPLTATYEGTYMGTKTINERNWVASIFDSNFNFLYDSFVFVVDTFDCSVSLTAEDTVVKVKGCDFDFEFIPQEGVDVYELFGRFAWPPINTDHFRVTFDHEAGSLYIDDSKAEPAGHRAHRFNGTIVE